VSVHAEQLGDVVELHQAISVDIQLLISFTDDGKPVSVWFSSDGAQEFIEGNSARTVSVEVIQNNLGHLVIKINVEVLEAPLELPEFNLLVAVLVKLTEYFSKASD